jgi:hypothetical protein
MRADNGDYSNLRNEDFSEFFSDNADSASSGELDTYGTPLVETTYIVSAGYTTRLAFGPLLFSDFGRSQGEGLAKGNWVVFVAPQTGKYTLMIGGTGQFTSSYETHPAGTTKSQAPQFDSSHPTPTFTSSEWLDAVKRQVPFLYDPAGYPNDGFSWNGTDVSPAAHRSFVDSSLDSCARFLANPDDPDASFRQSSLIEADRLLCSRD